MAPTPQTARIDRASRLTPTTGTLPTAPDLATYAVQGGDARHGMSQVQRPSWRTANRQPAAWHLIPLVALLLAISLALGACGSGASESSSGTTTSAAATQATGKGADKGIDVEPTKGMDFIVGFDSSYPPYGFIADDGSYTGFDLDLAKEVAARNGWKFTAQPINWDAKDAELDSGTITALWNGFTLEGREDKYTFSAPYMLNAQVVVVKKTSGITDLGSLAGKAVVTQVDSAALDVLKNNQKDLAATFGSLEERPDYDEAFMELKAGAVDAVACDLSIAQYQMAAQPGTYTQLPTSLSDEHYAVGFKRGSAKLADAVTATLRQMSADGTVEKIAKKYAAYGLSYSNWQLK
ncbi:MAG: amino acid ABC transporter substrate-binding protein [Actinomycetaceae bacterium]|nr:amino acid ABC transporter substrate-binding protein [Actinomycetaceae bacterium]MDY6082623.1 amino acid ABC transporter substrate-binding protein [Actinomycetaceae bacterium]